MYVKRRLMMVATAVAGCAAAGPTHWEHSAKDSEDYRQDLAACRAKALSPDVSLFFMQEVIAACMQGKGWYRAENPAPATRVHAVEE
jgi:hypothetical protein